MAILVTLSSAGVSPGLPCSGAARTTMVQVSAVGAPTTIDFTIQCTLDDLQRSPNPSWTNVSTSHYSTASLPDGVSVTMLSPVAGLRISSTTGTYSAGVNYLVLKKLESAY